LKTFHYIVIDERDSQDIAEFLGDEIDSEYENLNVGTMSIAEKRSLQRQGKVNCII